MRKRYVTFRLADAEYQNLKTKAAQAGVSVPVMARRLALDTAQIDQIADHIDRLERQIQAMPDRPMIVEIAQRLGAKIDRAASGKGGAA